MCKIDWNLIIQLFIAIGTVGAVIIAIWGDWFKYYLFPPILKIEVHNIAGVLGTEDKAIYYHLKVVNKRKWRIAKNCKVNLVEIYKKLPDNEFTKIPMVVESSFFWSPRNNTRISIDIHDYKEFDFLIAKETHAVRPLITFYPQNFVGNIKKNEIIRYALEIVAEGYRSRNKQIFEVAWNGVWTDNLGEMKNNLIIKEIM